MRKLIFDQEKDLDLDLTIKELRSRLDYMHDLEIDDLIDFFDKLASRFEVKNIKDFFSKTNLKQRLKIALHGNYYALDKWVDLQDPELLFHAQPRGLTVHWLAGNVPVLGLFSIFFALITKNVCLVKASLIGSEELAGYLNKIKDVETEKIKGRDLAKSIKAILINNDDKEMHQALSLAADVRIAWGGREAIKAITGLEKNIFSQDIIFGPKYSYALVDNWSEKTARKLAVDVSVFDQYACSSPHTVFVKEDALGFAKELAKQLQTVNRIMIPKGKIDPAKAAEIVSLRAEYEIKAQVFSSSSTDWTVVYSQGPGLAKGCFSRVIFVKPIKDILEIKEYNDRQKQSLGISLENKNQLDSITRFGIDRCPDLGRMTFYESPWDGMFVFDRLVRWVTTYK